MPGEKLGEREQERRETWKEEAEDKSRQRALEGSNGKS